MQTLYYDVHCFFNRGSGYSIPVKIETTNPYIHHELSDEQVIQYCITNNLFSEAGDENYVDDITQIDLEEYQDLKGEPK